MEQKDFLMNEIEKITNTLKIMVEKLFSINFPNDIQFKTIIENFSNLFKCSIQELINYSEDDLIQFCKNNNLNEVQLNLLAEIFVQLCNIEFDVKYLKTALTLLKEENRISSDYSIKRNEDINKIEKLIKNFN
jgi:hypothetical protein